MEVNKDESELPDLQPISNAFVDAIKEMEEEQEKFWNSLSKDEQLKAFCAISRRILEGEIEKRGTYRYVLYQVFGFGMEAYVQAQCAGYLSIHNSIVTDEDERQMLVNFCKRYNIEDYENKISEFRI